MALLLQIAYGQFFKSLNTLARTKTYRRLDAKSANFQKIIKMLFRLHSIQHPYLSKNKKVRNVDKVQYCHDHGHWYVETLISIFI